MSTPSSLVSSPGERSRRGRGLLGWPVPALSARVAAGRALVVEARRRRGGVFGAAGRCSSVAVACRQCLGKPVGALLEPVVLGQQRRKLALALGHRPFGGAELIKNGTLLSRTDENAYHPPAGSILHNFWCQSVQLITSRSGKSGHTEKTPYARSERRY